MLPSQNVSVSISHCLLPQTQTEAQKSRDLLKVSQLSERAYWDLLPSQPLPSVLQLTWGSGSSKNCCCSHLLGAVPQQGLPHPEEGPPREEGQDRLECGCHILQGCWAGARVSSLRVIWSRIGLPNVPTPSAVGRRECKPRNPTLCPPPASP